LTADDRADPDLYRIIRDEIAARGPVSFARFMDLALHHPRHGYYSAGPSRLGREGDFFTASDVGTAFGRSLASQCVEMDELLGRPDPFQVVEFGAGRGLLARDTLDAMPDLSPSLAGRLRYAIVDNSGAMRQEAGRRAPEARVVSDPSEIASAAGCVFAVELFDALPVHRVRRRAGVLVEVAVDVDSSGTLIEIETSPEQEVARLAERYGAAPGEGDESEICPAALAQLDLLAAVIRRGFIVIVDYGYPARELYGPSRRRGTLLAYHRHATNEDYLERLGHQDLTAHVNFTLLEDRAREIGLDLLGLTTQDRFLIANDALAAFDETDETRWRDPANVRERLRVLQLIHPEGMGRIFKVLVLSKGLRPTPQLNGLNDPFAR
jgi:SAM-dependent MidA family methyltransferase